MPPDLHWRASMRIHKEWVKESGQDERRRENEGGLGRRLRFMCLLVILALVSADGGVRGEGDDPAASARGMNDEAKKSCGAQNGNDWRCSEDGRDSHLSHTIGFDGIGLSADDRNQDRGGGNTSPPGRETKYQLAACTLYRDEDRYLREWLEFHLCNGFDHFFLYSDRQTATCHLEILAPYVAAGKVTIATAFPRESPQIPTFADCVGKHGDEARWLAFIDVDEFLFSPQGLVIENYVHRKRLPECNGGTCAFKVIAQGNLVEDVDVHNHYYKSGYFAVNEKKRRIHDDASLLPTESEPGDFPADVLRLHHYKTKSLHDTMLKLNRDGINGEENETLNPKTRAGRLRYFQQADFNDVHDTSAQAHTECVLRGLNRTAPMLTKRALACEESLPEAVVAEEGGSQITTIVTSLFYVNVPEVIHNWRERYSHIRNIITYIDTPIVIFTFPEFAPYLMEMREGKENSMLVIIVPSSELSIEAQEHFEQYLESEKIEGVTVNDLVLGGLKMSFLHRAANENPFDTSFFFWIDADTFQDEDKMPQYSSWPSAESVKRLPTFQILLLEPQSVHGVFGGHIEGINFWNQHFYTTFEAQLSTGNFAGSDSAVMDAACATVHWLCRVVLRPAHWSPEHGVQSYLIQYLL